MCQNLVQNNECKFYKTYEEKRNTIINIYQSKVMDIEDWLKEGKKENFCVFYSMKNFVHNAHLVIVPFETILDPKTAELLSNYIEGSILVIEDADLFEAYALDVFLL